MASEGSSSTGIVAIVAILLLVMVGGFIAWQAGVFGGGDGGSTEHKIDVDVNRK